MAIVGIALIIFVTLGIMVHNINETHSSRDIMKDILNRKPYWWWESK